MLYSLSQFQSTLPRRERRFPLLIKNRTREFQSTLPRRERQKGDCWNMAKRSFQSTLPRRERPGGRRTAPDSADFNPRSREGSDITVIPEIPNHPISIHAPAKGATHILSMLCLLNSFQSTLPRRERHWGAVVAV